MDLFADRTSTHWMASNQLRLWFSAFAHLIMPTLRAEVLAGTSLAHATVGTIRLRLFKIAVRIKVSVRRVVVDSNSSLHTALISLQISSQCDLPSPR